MAKRVKITININDCKLSINIGPTLCPFSTNLKNCACEPLVQCEPLNLRAAVIPLYTQWFAAIASFQQTKLKQYWCIQKPLNKRLIVIYRHTHYRGVQHGVSR